jgi:peroxiredoxin
VDAWWWSGEEKELRMSQKIKKKTNWLVIGLISGGLVLLLCIGCGVVTLNAPKLYTAYLTGSSLKIGQTAPDFELKTLAGDTVRLSHYRGQPVLLTFGASWCPDCAREAPLLKQLNADHPELVILLVDSNEDSPTVQGYVDRSGFTFPVLLDTTGTVNKQYQIFAIPTELFIDQQGVIRAKVVETVTPELLGNALPLIGMEP